MDESDHRVSAVALAYKSQYKNFDPCEKQTKHVVILIAHTSTEIREDERTGDASLNFIPSLATDTAETKQGLMVPIRVSS